MTGKLGKLACITLFTAARWSSCLSTMPSSAHNTSMTWKGEKVDDLEIIHWWRSSGCDEWVVVVVRNKTLGKKEESSASMAAFMCSCFEHKSSCSQKTEWFDISTKQSGLTGKSITFFVCDCLSENPLVKHSCVISCQEIYYSKPWKYCTTEIWSIAQLNFGTYSDCPSCDSFTVILALIPLWNHLWMSFQMSYFQLSLVPATQS